MSYACKCTLGVCIMRKKSESRGMRMTLRRLKEFNPMVEVIVFPEETVLHKAVEEWPICDFLIAFHSSGFPIDKAAKYSELRKPILLCDIQRQYDILDRRKVLEILRESGIPYPKSFISNNEDEVVQEGDVLIFTKDGITQRLEKPFIEKPANSEDHNVWLYYPSSSGGGIRKLFRKTHKASSEFHPGEWKIRRDGSYVYQHVYESEGSVDIKIYTVGTDFFYAESRKAPTVDGIVERTENGKELRKSVGLSATEIEIARKIASTMNQFVCGFDLLRRRGESYVIDVNGWSFVKGNEEYYLKTGQLLAQFISSQHNKLTKSPEGE